MKGYSMPIQTTKIPLAQFAEQELRRAGYYDNEDDKRIADAVVSLVDYTQHSGWEGFSIDTVIQLYRKLVNRRPLTALTGDDSEWSQFNNQLMQNRRCPSVFKSADGKAWDTDAVIRITDAGHIVIDPVEKHYITFPYTPKVEIIRQS